MTHHPGHWAKFVAQFGPLHGRLILSESNLRSNYGEQFLHDFEDGSGLEHVHWAYHTEGIQSLLATASGLER